MYYLLQQYLLSLTTLTQTASLRVMHESSEWMSAMLVTMQCLQVHSRHSVCLPLSQPDLKYRHQLHAPANTITTIYLSH